MMRFLCRLGLHDFNIVHGCRATEAAPAVTTHMRCVWCGKTTKGWETGPAPIPRYTGYLTASEVRRIRRRGVTPAYVTPQVEAELKAALVAKAAKAEARKRRGPVVVPIQRKA